MIELIESYIFYEILRVKFFFFFLKNTSLHLCITKQALSIIVDQASW